MQCFLNADGQRWRNDNGNVENENNDDDDDDDDIGDDVDNIRCKLLNIS